MVHPQDIGAGSVWKVYPVQHTIHGNNDPRLSCRNDRSRLLPTRRGGIKLQILVLTPSAPASPRTPKISFEFHADTGEGTAAPAGESHEAEHIYKKTTTPPAK